MDIGTGIATGSAILGSILGVVAVIFKMIPRKEQDKASPAHCADHSGVCANLKSLDAWLNKIEQKLDKVIEGRVG